MVGGKVIGLIRRGESTLLNVQDKNGDECAVRCVEKRTDNGKAVRIDVGDSVWWQSGKVYWTPATATRAMDVPLEKVGYSH